MLKRIGLLLVSMLFLFSVAACGSNPPGDGEKSTAEERPAAALLSGAVKEGEAPKVKLNSGYDMPVLGLGTWTLTGGKCENAVYVALKDGYRLIDTAKYYGNETEVGRGLKRAINEGIVTREEVFITSKIGPYGYNDYDGAIEECRKNLGVDYIDLMLIHQSGRDDVEIYDAIERAIDKGIVRSLGISNYYTKADFDRVTANQAILPAVVQNENHIFYQNTEFQNCVSRYGTYVESYYPFGGRGHTGDSMNHEEIRKIAAAHNKTGAQVILRWHLQAGYIAIPGSGNPEHIAENFNVFDFELSDTEMRTIKGLNTGKRYENW